MAVATLDTVNDYRKQLEVDYKGQYLNRSEHLLTSGFDYDSVSVVIKPLSKATLGDIEFNGNIIFSSVVKSQYGADVKTHKSLNFNFFIAKQSSCNFGSDRVEKKLLPFIDGKYESSGHFHPFYKSVSDVLEETLIDEYQTNTRCPIYPNLDERNTKLWWSLLLDYEQTFRPVDFGLAVLAIVDKQFQLYIKYNAFEWQTSLNWNEDLQQLEKKTKSKKICKKSVDFAC